MSYLKIIAIVKRVRWILSMLFLPQALLAQTYYFETYGVKEGLAQSTVYAIIQDSKGFVWLGTSAGVSRFNGLTFENFTLSDGLAKNGVRAITQDSKGGLWFGHTGGGVSRFNGKNFESIQGPKLSTSADITAIVETAEGTLWLGTNGSGAISIDNPSAAKNALKFTVYNSNSGLSDRIFCITKIKDERIFFVTDVGIKLFDHVKKHFISYNPEGSPTYFQVTCLHEDNSGNLWMGTFNGGLYMLEKATQKFTVFDVRDQLANNWISSLTSDHEGNLWAGTWGGGITSIARNTGGKRPYKMNTFNTGNGLPDNKIRCLTTDKEGNVLIGSNENGLSVFKGSLFVDYEVGKQVTANHIWTIAQQSNGNFWLGTNDGITVLDSSSVGEQKSHPLLHAPKNVRHLKIDRQHNTWIGTWGNGVFQYPKGRTESIAFPAINDYISQGFVTCLETDLQDNLWIGTIDGLLRYATKTKSVSRFTQSDGISGNDISVLFNDTKGNLWIGSKGKGLSIYHNGLFDIKDAAQQSSPISITEDKHGKIWVATEGQGVFVYNQQKPFKTFKVTDGLLSDYISCVIADNKNNIWIGTNKGINRISQERNDMATFTEKEGFVGIEVKPDAVLKDNWGKLWFGTVKGVLQCQPIFDKPNLTQVIPCITKLRVNLIETPLTPDLSLNHTEKNITFNYAAISLSNASAVRYRVMLEGIDTAWQASSGQSYTNYPHLPAGNYIFKVKACNSQGVWNSPATTFTFTISPPFWKTWWFISSCILVLIFSVFSYIKNREKELLETNKILEDKVQKRTAEVVQKNRELEQVNIEVHEQKAIIEEKNKDIIDSIMYAKRIQEAILPNLKQAHALMDPFFVLYKPKDIVSGDLYWIEAVEEKVLFAAMDCTGHGVPGALVSIVAHNSLNRAVKELNIKTPSLILDKLNDFVEETFSKSESAVNDGLDIALCLLDRKNNILEFAAAYNPLYQIRKGALTVIKADKQPIGKFAERTPFTNHIIETQAGDGYYIFSDGYADQFGGPKGKKFKYAQFEQLLLSIYTLPMQQQLEILNKTMDEWKGPLEQIDDICVFGFRV